MPEPAQQAEMPSSKLAYTPNKDHMSEGCSAARTHLAVKRFSNHRNAIDHITSNLEEPVDNLQSPLKGRRASDSGSSALSLAEKRATAQSRSARRQVVIEQQKRYRVRRKVVDQIGHRGTAFRKAFSDHFSGTESILFPAYKGKLQALGVVLSEEDFRHLWDLCSEPAREAFLGAVESPARLPVSGKSHIDMDGAQVASSISVARLAEAVGITEADVFLGNKDKEKERKCMAKAAIVGQKVANSLQGRKKYLQQALKISDVRQNGVLEYGEFKACLRSAGILISESDCLALLGTSRNVQTGEVDYERFLQQMELDSRIHRKTQHMFQDPISEQKDALLNQDDKFSDIDQMHNILHRPNKGDHQLNECAGSDSTVDVVGNGIRESLRKGEDLLKPRATRSLFPPWEEHPDSLPVNEIEDPKLKREAISLARITRQLIERLPELQKTLAGGHQSSSVSFGSFCDGLRSAGVVLDAGDARILYERSLDKNGALDLSRVVRDRDGMAPTYLLRPSGVQGYSCSPPSSGGEAPREDGPGSRAVSQQSVPRRGWASVQADVRISEVGGGPMEERWGYTIADSKVGNPFQLARMFRKYDTEQGKHSKTVLLDEFVQVMMDSNLGKILARGHERSVPPALNFSKASDFKPFSLTTLPRSFVSPLHGLRSLRLDVSTDMDEICRASEG
jgi:hypothetical protein